MIMYKLDTLGIKRNSDVSCIIVLVEAYINTNDTMIYINRDTSIHERVQIKKCNSYSLICKKRMFLESYIFLHAFPQGK